MAHGVKYRIPYYRKSGGQTTIDILKRDYAGAITVLKGGGSPFELTKDGDVSNIYEPTIGLGVVLNTVSSSSLSLIELFTTDPQEFIIKIYNGVSGSTLIWQGFVSSELYRENFSKALPQVVSIYGNDAMKVLENIKYLQADGSYYTGTATIATILSNIFSKLEISFTTIYTSNDLEVFDDGETQVTNPFLYLELANENFIDEQGEAMSCRDVLKGVIGGLGGLCMFFLANDVYIIDPINLHDTGKGKSYDASTFGSETVISTLGGYVDISDIDDDIFWRETGTQLDIFPQYNEVIVKYDPYSLVEILYDFSDSNNWDVAGTFVDWTDYWMNTGVEFANWSSTNSAGTNFAAIKESEYAIPEYFILLGESHDLITWDVPLSNITQCEYVNMKISFEAWVQTKENSLNIYCDGTPVDIYQVKVPITVQIGTQTWGGGNQWTEDSSIGDEEQELLIRQEGVSNEEFADDPTQSLVNDRWTNISIIVPLKQSVTEQLIQGDIIISILDDLHYFVNPITPWASEASVHYVLLKNPKISFVDTVSGIEIANKGIEKKAVLNANLTGKSPHIISVTCGTGRYGISRGAYKTISQVVVGTNIVGLYRGDLESNLTQFTTEELLLQSVMSQYKQPRYMLTGKIDVHNYLLNIFTKLIKYSDHLGSKAFYIINGTYIDREEIVDATLLEIENIREDI